MPAPFWNESPTVMAFYFEGLQKIDCEKDILFCSNHYLGGAVADPAITCGVSFSNPSATETGLETISTDPCVSPSAVTLTVIVPGWSVA